MNTDLQNTLEQLKCLGHEKVRAQNLKHGATDKQYGVKLGDIRKVAARIRGCSEDLYQALWDSQWMEARLLAILLIKPDKLSFDQVDKMVRSVDCVQVADWLSAYILKNHPEKESFRLLWLKDSDPWVLRAGFSLTYERICKDLQGIDIDATLDRIEAEIGSADSRVQWTMNFCLGGIGIHSPPHRDRAIAIGEKLGLYRDYPVSKGCTSPFVPIWVREIVGRNQRP